MQKVVLPGLVDLLLGNVTVPGRFDPHRIAGFVTRLEDVPTGSAWDLARRYGLDQVPGWPVSSELHVLRFFARHPAPFISPFGRHVYQMDLLELPAGTELWRIDSSTTGPDVWTRFFDLRRCQPGVPGDQAFLLDLAL